PVKRWLDAWIDRRTLGKRLDVMALALPTLTVGWRVLIAFVCLPLLALIVSTPLEPLDQALFAVLMLGLAMFSRQMPGKTARVFLLTLSIVATLRYLWWRVTGTMPVGEPVDLVFALILFAAELYAVTILLLGYFQTAWPLNREEAPLPDSRAEWPSVDVYIPTYNEPLKVLRPTVLAALGLDWPADKLSIWVLDDGRRDDIKRFSEEAGVNYLIRPNNFHAKAGNLNHALQYSTGDYIAIFDCDHIPTRPFLRSTMGWFLKDPKCAVVQTPHHFFSPDPFRRNLGMADGEPAEDMLFHGLLQDGNDFWNATFFCGSCAVIKRGPLLEVGGIAVETVTEDAHTALKLHRRGYTTAFINKPQAAGLSTESIAGHVGQRVRWARGMIQIFRTDNPWSGPGLSFAQRLCYTSSMLHFLYGIPRLIFLLAPMAYLFFGLHLIATTATAIIAYILPQLIHANLANSRAQGQHRHSFWSEIYETVMAWYIAVPTTMALINPKLGKFNVTSKGSIVDNSFYDWGIAKPYLALIVINIAGLIFGIVRLLSPDSSEVGTVLLNVFWVLYNLVVLGVAMGASRETQQLRVSPRVNGEMPVVLYRLGGQAIRAQSVDYSMTGLGVVLPKGIDLNDGEHVRLLLPSDDDEMAFSAQVMWRHHRRVGLRFENLTLRDEANLVRCTFARPGAWYASPVVNDKPWRSLARINTMCWQAYGELFLLIPAYWRSRRMRQINPTVERS
ncbi:MAG: UDP-forming cellulose synthase catalytic subunit, partial [Paraperlucidibaca sp.]